MVKKYEQKRLIKEMHKCLGGGLLGSREFKINFVGNIFGLQWWKMLSIM